MEKPGSEPVEHPGILCRARGKISFGGEYVFFQELPKAFIF